MKGIWGRGLIVTGILALFVVGLLYRSSHAPSRKQEEPSPAPQPASAPEKDVSPNPQSNIVTLARNFGVRKAILSSEERAELDTKFSTQIKPAFEKWRKAYEGHLPFNADDLTLDKFREQIARNKSFKIYTFMLGDITLCVQDMEGRVVVNYMNDPKQSKQLLALPNGEAPTLKMPVTRNDIIRMVKADSGTEFKPNEVVLRASGLGSAMNGGALVDIGPLGGDPNNALCKLSLVFGADGNLVYYCRDPFF